MLHEESLEICYLYKYNSSHNCLSWEQVLRITYNTRNVSKSWVEEKFNAVQEQNVTLHDYADVSRASDWQNFEIRGREIDSW
jgi:hypothetical protein